MSAPKSTITVKITSTLKDAIDEIAGQLEQRTDVFERMSDAEVCRRLMAWAVVEHRAGRGPWPRR